ncbi:hypothetical protein ACIOJ9_28565 [Streptomyces sp. NPDC088175]|uniref:hypothetical protein n=1 Tax=unclassified Streptomyces TaxID=2593676 RepID=UPI0037F43ABE
METQTCPSTYSREREDDRTTYTCVRETGHPGVHDSGLTEKVFVHHLGYEVEGEIRWTDWEEFLAAQRTAPDTRVLELGTTLANKDEWYANALTRQPRYAALTTA